jgi:HSP20 family protein
MGRLLERHLGVAGPNRAWNPFRSGGTPAVNVWQDDDSIHVETELPGMTEDDIEVTIRGKDLTIGGERIEPAPPAGTTVHRRERFTGVFGRVVHLPVEVDHDAIDATFRNGVLTVTLAKADAARLRHVPIRTPEREDSHER